MGHVGLFVNASLGDHGPGPEPRSQSNIMIGTTHSEVKNS
jgi:hypothetical protein